jgi:hypothetical protein
MKNEPIPCNDLTYFEMCSGLRWAMYVMNAFPNVKLVLDVTGVDKSARWFLANNIPQAYADTNLVKWFAVQKENTIECTIEYTIEYTNGDTSDTAFYIRSFTCSTFPSSLYVSLYDMSTNSRFAPMCLIIWDRKHPEVTNPGYAEGRCPQHIIL